MCSFDRQDCEEEGRSGVDVWGFEVDVDVDVDVEVEVEVEVEVVDAFVTFRRGAVKLLLSFSVDGSGTWSLDGSAIVGMICMWLKERSAEME